MRNRAGEYVAGKKAVRLDGKFFDFLEHLANKYGGKAEADEEWLDQIAGMIEEAPLESFVDSAALESWIEARMRRGEREGLKNSTDANGMEHGDDDGKFTGDGGGGGGKGKGKESKAEKSARQKANAERGAAGMATVEAGKDCPHFMQSKKLGNIALYQGDENSGYVHIKNNPAENHQVMLRDNNIPQTLAYGKYYPDKGGWMVVNGSKCVMLGKDGNRGVKIVTAYESASKAAEFTRRGGQIENSCAGVRIDATYCVECRGEFHGLPAGPQRYFLPPGYFRSVQT